MQVSILTRIQRRLDSLSPSEKRVGDWILANSARAVDAPIVEVASAADVSEPTVIRFCRSIGVSGFRELRTHLIAAMQRPDSYLHHDVGSADSPVDAAVKVLESSVRALIDLRKLVTSMPFGPAVSSMAQARQLVFVGLGASGIVAKDAQHKFFRLGLPCSAAVDSQTILQQSAISQPDDVYVAVSHTGQWPDLVQGMKSVRERRGTVIALTDPHSELAGVASYLFDCHPHEDTNVFTPMTSRLAQLVLLDALQVAVALEMGETAEENLRLSKAALLLNRPRPEWPEA